MNEGLVALVRALIAFFSLLIFAKVLGKQQISQLTFFDYILGITIGSIAATLTTDLSSRAWPHWLGLLVWVICGFSMEYITMKFRYASKFIDGEPTIVIMNGQIMENTLRKMKYKVSELQGQLRTKGVFNLTEIQYAVLEPNGEISVLKKPEHQPLTPKDMKITPQNNGIGIELIYDGVIIHQNLRQVNRNVKWLKSELRKQGVKDPSEVFLATAESSGTLYIDKYSDKIKKPIDVGDYNGPY